MPLKSRQGLFLRHPQIGGFICGHLCHLWYEGGYENARHDRTIRALQREAAV